MLSMLHRCNHENYKGDNTSNHIQYYTKTLQRLEPFILVLLV